MAEMPSRWCHTVSLAYQSKSSAAACDLVRMLTVSFARRESRVSSKTLRFIGTDIFSCVHWTKHEQKVIYRAVGSTNEFGRMIVCCTSDRYLNRLPTKNKAERQATFAATPKV